MFAEGRDYTLVLPWISSEDIFDDDDCFLHDVGHLCLYEVEKRFDAAVCCWFHFDGQTTDGPHGFPHEVDVDFGRIPDINVCQMALQYNRWYPSLLLQLC